MSPRALLDNLLIEPDALYRVQAKTNLSSHALADFRACPLLYHHKQIGLIPDSDSTAFLVGRATHVLALEGRAAYEAGFAVGGPINEKTGKPFGRDTKAFAEWAAGCAKPVLSQDQADLVEALADSVLRHPVAALLLCDGVAERVARLSYAGVPCQGRFDWIAPQFGLVDLKTCDDLTWFEHDARRFGYAHQMAFYRALLREACGESLPVTMIAVEKRAPYRCGVWQISDQVLDAAERENLAAMRQLEHCRQTGEWPTGYEESRTFDYL
jgi:hypothetical protein